MLGSRETDGPVDARQAIRLSPASAFVQWRNSGPLDAGFLGIDQLQTVKLSRKRRHPDLREAFHILQQVPFDLCSTVTLHSEWRRGRCGGEEYFGPSLGDAHWNHGWICAFRGERGHARIPSRRFLEYGPWRLHRLPGDISVVQFHDLEAEPCEALEQARPAHFRMGASPEGGFFWEPYPFKHELKGNYDPASRTHFIPVLDREVGLREMTDAAAAIRYQVFGPEKPLDNLAYVFLREEQAHSHLHEMWVRGLQVYVMRQGRQVRIDADYQPVHEPPDWVKRAIAREVAAKARDSSRG